jgi:hypothetical protein
MDNSLGYGLLMGLVSLLLTLAVPIIIIVLIVRLVTRHSQKDGHGTGLHAPIGEVTPRQITLGVLVLAAGYAGIAALYVLPMWVMNLSAESSIFAVRLVAGLASLMVGLALLRERMVSLLLMTVGIVTMLLAAPYIFSNFGSAGTLVVIFLVLAALIGLAVYFSRKEQAK